MKQIAIVMMLILFMNTALSAQDHRRSDRGDRSEMTAQEIATKKTDKMSRILQLKDKQTKELYQINLIHAEKMKGLKSSLPKQTRDNREHSKHEAKAMHRESFLNDIRPILSPEQIKILDSAKEERGPKGPRLGRTDIREGVKKGDKNPNTKAEMLTERLTNLLNLTAEQQRQVSAISKKHAATRAAKKDEMKASFESAKVQLEAEHNAYVEAVTRILDAKQADAFRAMLEMREEKREGVRGMRKGERRR